MFLLKGLLALILAVAVIAVGLYVADLFELTDRLTGAFLNVQTYLPTTLTFEAFLVGCTIAAFLVALLVVAGCAGIFSLFSAKLVALKAHIDILNRRVDPRVGEYEQLASVAKALDKQLDKRVLVQAIVEEASRLTSVPHANTAVTLWLLHFETDTFRFEHGLYCDEAMFVKNEWHPTEGPFGRMLNNRKIWTSADWEKDTTLIKPDRIKRVGSGLIVVPLIIEGSVLGVLMLFCHPDVVAAYPKREGFYELLWGQLSLGLAIGVQGEVAILDRLTGVHNREYFMKRLTQEVERANRFQLSLSLLMIDIDNFKPVNDTLGHPQGDAVLKIIAKLIRKSVRAIDLVGRYGGEEFIVMLPETGQGDDPSSATGGAPLVAERIRASVEEEFKGLQKPLDLTVSLGVAIRRFPEDREEDYKDLVRHADEHLYKAKTTGKNKVCIYQPENTKVG